MKKEYLSLRIKNKLYNIVVKRGTVKYIKPSIIEIFPTLKCNLNCSYCDRGKEDSVLENFNDINVLYNNLKNDPNFCLLNFRISGGEPTLYPRVNQLIYLLHSIHPETKIDFLTNAIKLEKLTQKSISFINISPSIYPYSEKIIKKRKRVFNLLKSFGIKVKTNFFFHEDMDLFGSIKNDFDPLSCFVPTLLCGTKLVFPCCRAHRLEQSYKKAYHLKINSKNLYIKLKKIITNSDLCIHCPRLYRDRVIIPLA